MNGPNERALPTENALSRRGFLATAGAAVAASTVVDVAPAAPGPPATPRSALAALMRGNERYRSGRWRRRDYSPVGERRASAQAPFAAVVSCADSRVSPPLVFDVERGNLFAAHVAGNCVDAGTLGSIEFAVAVLEVRLVMVLGHSDCGAVKAALAVANGTAAYPPATHGAIGDLVDKIVPAVRPVVDGRRALARGTVANARFQAAALRARDPIIAPAVRRGDLRVVAAVYGIGSGRVSLV